SRFKHTTESVMDSQSLAYWHCHPAPVSRPVHRLHDLHLLSCRYYTVIQIGGFVSTWPAKRHLYYGVLILQIGEILLNGVESLSLLVDLDMPECHETIALSRE